MDVDGFWKLIDDARNQRSGLAGLFKKADDGPKTSSATPKAMKAILSALSDEEVQEFGRHFYRELIRLNQWSVWGAGYVIAGGMSDDSFHYFRSWLIGKGREAVELALRDPDALGPFIDNPEVDNELLEYVTLEVLEARGISEDPREDIEGSPDDSPEGEPFDEDALATLYPRLSAVFG